MSKKLRLVTLAVRMNRTAITVVVLAVLSALIPVSGAFAGHKSSDR